MKKKIIAVGIATLGTIAGIVSLNIADQAAPEPTNVSQAEHPVPPAEPEIPVIPVSQGLANPAPVSDRIILALVPSGELARLARQPDGFVAVEQAINSVVAKHEVEVRIRTRLADFGDDLYQLEVTGRALDRARMDAVLAALGSMPGVERSEEDVLMQPLGLPNDAMLASQWSIGAKQADIAAINAPGAWVKINGGVAPVIAILDTGITNHSDLTANVLPGYNFISDPDIAGNGVGRSNNAADLGDAITDDDQQKPKFAQCPIRNSSWHGTHVAGIAAAAGNNNRGIAGVSYTSKILPVRVLGKCGGYMSDIAAGVLWAAGLPISDAPANATPAKVINMSLGGTSACGSLMSSAIARATNAGALVVAAAGNEARDVKQVAPANCPNVISVAATKKNGDRAEYSNFGAVTLAAPGGYGSGSDATGMILATYNTGRIAPASESYAYLQGTSMATPHVAGLAALVAATNDRLTPDEIRGVLVRSATPFAAGTLCAVDKGCGAGIIDATAAIDDAESYNPNFFADRVRGAQYWVPKVTDELALTLGNSGNAAYSGEVGVQVYLSASYVYNPAENPVLVGELKPELKLAASKGRAAIRIPVTIPENIPEGAYYLVTRINGGDAPISERSYQDNDIEHGPIMVVRPKFSVTLNRKSEQAPSFMRLIVAPDDPKLASLTRAWKYEWTVPGNVEVQRDYGRELRVTMNQPGSAQLRLKVSTPNGEYSQVLSQDVVTVDPQPFEVSFKVLPSNRFLRAPLSIIVSPMIRGGHPEDRVTSNTIAVGEADNAQVTQRSRGVFLDLPAGEHTVRYVAQTRHGKKIEATQNVVVIPNTPPVCELTHKRGTESFTFFAHCTDEDGRMKGYSWQVNGEPRQVSTYRLIVPADIAINGKINVQVTGYDDSQDGHTVNQTVVVN